MYLGSIEESFVKERLEKVVMLREQSSTVECKIARFDNKSRFESSSETFLSTKERTPSIRKFATCIK